MTLLEMPFTTKEKIVIQSNTYKMREVVEALIVEVDQQKYEELISLKSVSSKPKKQLKLKCPQGGCRCRKKEMKRKEKKKGKFSNWLPPARIVPAGANPQERFRWSHPRVVPTILLTLVL